MGSPALHPATALQLGLGGAPAPSLLAWAQLSRLEALSDRDLWGWSQPGTLSVEAKQTHEKPWREECVCVCVCVCSRSAGPSHACTCVCPCVHVFARVRRSVPL